MPFDEYLYRAGEDARIIFEAQQAALQQCMTDRGFDYPTADYHSHDPLARRFGLLDLESARTRGYQSAESQGASRREPLRDMFESLSEAEKQAWLQALRDGSDSCEQKVDEALGDYQSSDVQQLRQTVRRLGAQARDAAIRDERVARALNAWSSCMAERGHSYETPWEPMEDSSIRGGAGQQAPEEAPAQASAEEIAAAVDDVECKHQTALVETWRSVETEYQRSLMEDNPAPFEALAERRERLVQRAKTLSDQT